ncbi:MAG: hypothetical protein A2X03_00270 [Bacteroidetes bacterium GWA2_40_15]|nr:MAG: hypothetical protein A2X03_00270 [Bacteroidetes bacterium GWA2_40_15]
MYSTRSNLILGFHGCEKAEQEKLISDSSYIRTSNEFFDWLGHGMYFWENNPRRGLLWAEQKKKAGTLKEPAVIGAVIDLGRCLDLLDSRNIELLKTCYNLFKVDSEKLDKPISINEDHPVSESRDKVLRYLDCAVIEYTHKLFTICQNSGRNGNQGNLLLQNCSGELR